MNAPPAAGGAFTYQGLFAVPIGVHGLPFPAGSAHLVNTELCPPAHLVKGFFGVGVALGNIAGAAGINDVGQGLAAGLFIGLQDLQNAVALAG